MHYVVYEFYPMSTFCSELKVIAKLERREEKKNNNSLFEAHVPLDIMAWYITYVRAYFLFITCATSMYRSLFFLFTIYHVLSALFAQYRFSLSTQRNL